MRARIALSLAAVALAAGIGLAQTGSSRPPSRSLAYSRLNDKARDLFDRWAARQNQPPPQAYESLTVSQRTTFEGATHALSRSRLTNASGTRIGLAIDLVDSLESILGEDKSTGRGDCNLLCTPGWRRRAQKLGEAREFSATSTTPSFTKAIRQLPPGWSLPEHSVLDDGGRHAPIPTSITTPAAPQALFNGHLRVQLRRATGVNYTVTPSNGPACSTGGRAAPARWPSLSAGARRRRRADLPDGAKIDRIEDATQEFFNDRLVRRNLVRRASPMPCRRRLPQCG
jgi:hypothetical protein